MSLTDQAITATDFLNYAYCKRIIYYVYVLKQPQFTTTKEYKGREKFEEFEKKSKRNKLVPDFPQLPKRYNLYLYDPETNLKTFPDCVIFDENKKEAFPYQLKYGKKPEKVYLTQKYQLWLESFLIEKTLGYKSTRGFIKYVKDDALVEVDLTGKENIIQIASEIKEIIRSERLPEPTEYEKRCVDCCYRKMCWGE